MNIISPNIFKKIKKYKFIFKLQKKRVTSNASRSIYTYNFFLPLMVKHKKLTYFKKNNAGRALKTKKLLRSRGSRKIKYLNIKINYSFRHSYLYFIGGLVFIPFLNKAVSVIFLANGAVTYFTTTNNHFLFHLQRPQQNLNLIGHYARHATLTYQNYHIETVPIIIKHLPKNKDVCLIEQFPNDGIKYIRSSGSKGKVLKMDTRTNIAIVELPSKNLKTISIYSLGSKGFVFFSENKKYKNTKSGYYRNHGIKSIVRGVAMNPVDHPHGGRTKSIKLPRTPWGTVAKLK
uniref:Ribosomal protein L2 n=1 Tax=Strombidium sp. TaxID=181122 RepID=A0A7T0Q5R7_9SPIT|nr:ribosomal protein L2 [Strombidium sp.]